MRLYLVTTVEGMPVTWCLANPKLDERDVMAALLEVDHHLVQSGQVILADRGFAHPTGLARSPVFSSYGWNTTVAGQLTTPTLVIHGIDDNSPAPVTNADTIYNNLTMTNKVLVKVACASHALLFEGCSGKRCTRLTLRFERRDDVTGTQVDYACT